MRPYYYFLLPISASAVLPLGKDAAVWITVCSPMLECFPIVTSLRSPLMTELNQTVLPAPMMTYPTKSSPSLLTVAFGATQPSCPYGTRSYKFTLVLWMDSFSIKAWFSGAITGFWVLASQHRGRESRGRKTCKDLRLKLFIILFI